MSGPDAGTLVAVEETRGTVIERRMKSLGLGATELATAADVSRAVIYRVIGDAERVSDRSYTRVENALARLEDEAGHGGPDGYISTSDGLIEFEVTGDFGVRVVVKGPIGNAGELEASVARLIADIRAQRGPDS